MVRMRLKCVATASTRQLRQCGGSEVEGTDDRVDRTVKGDRFSHGRDRPGSGQVRRLTPSWRWRWRAGHSINVEVRTRVMAPPTRKQTAMVSSASTVTVTKRDDAGRTTAGHIVALALAGAGPMGRTARSPP